MAQRLLSPSHLHGTSEALRIPLQTDADGLHFGTFYHEAISQRDRRTDRGDLGVAANHRDEMGFRLTRRVRQYFADEAVQADLDAGRRFLCALHVGQPAEAE